MKKMPLMFGCCLMVLCLSNCAMKPEESAHIPIFGWRNPYGANETQERYQEMRDAGFDYMFTSDNVQYSLDLCEKVGMKAFVRCPELRESPEETVAKYKNHPAVAGWFLSDEPDDGRMEELAEWKRRIESVDKEHPCFLNLLPSYCFTPEGYVKHLRLITEKVGMPEISFDNYPVFYSDIDGDGEAEVHLNPSWYQNLEMVSAEARRAGVPFWAFALSTAHTNIGLAQFYTPTPAYPIPTIDHLRIQMYSNLAYGAQQLEYYSYWTPDTTNSLDFHDGPISLSGRRSPVYERVREMNEEIQRRAFVWAGCTVESVCHIAEDSIPIGTKPLAVLPAHFQTLKNEKGHGLVSAIRNGKHHYVMLVNTSPVDEWHVRVETDEGVQLVRRDGSRIPATRYDPLFILTPGNCEIFEID